MTDKVIADANQKSHYIRNPEVLSPDFSKNMRAKKSQRGIEFAREMDALPEEDRAFLQTIPLRFRKFFYKVYFGKLGAVRRIKAMCLHCENYNIGNIARCQDIRCPLHQVRPYKTTLETNPIG